MKWRSLEEATHANEARPLRDIYAERKELIAKCVAADVQAVHARVVDELHQLGIAERALKPGHTAPDFRLTNHNGKPVRGSELRERGPLIICFFRGRWCPFCVGQMEAMNAMLPQFQELGASLVAISPQTVHQSYLMADQHKLRFPVLSDAGNQVARQFGLIYRVPEYQQEIYSRAFVNLPFINGESSWELPIPATYLINTDKSNNHGEPLSASLGTSCGSQSERLQGNTILYASADADYTARPEPSDILQRLAQFLS
jgi:peroxiredoxin